jgi:hypothetical protein
MSNKLFIPPGAVEFDRTVRLASGTYVPKYAFVAVPILAIARNRLKDSRSSNTIYADVVTGKLSSTKKPVSVQGSGAAQDSTNYDFSYFSRTIDVKELMKHLENALPITTRGVVDSESDPGYFSALLPAPGGEITPTLDEVPDSDDIVSATFTFGSLLVADRVVQTLVDTQGLTKLEIARNLEYLAVNVLDNINANNPNIDGTNPGYSARPLTFSLLSGWHSITAPTIYDESHTGKVIRIEPSGTSAQIYQKAVDLALKLNFEEISLDYYDGEPTVITIVASYQGNGGRRLNTRFDDIISHAGKLVHIIKSDDVLTEITETLAAGFSGADLYLDPEDDYTSLAHTIINNPTLFGGIDQALSLMRSLGFSSNPFLSGIAGRSPIAGTGGSLTPTSLDSIASAIRCPTTTNDDDDLFPTSSHPNLRQISNLSQLDDKSTQNAQQFPLRTNNPLRVKKIAGVTDLVTRFGYLGESEGIAVYRDHIGGAAAGLNYLMTQGSGLTVGKAAQSLFGDKLSSLSAGGGSGTDITSLTSSKVFSSLTQHLFGATDPTGALAECATIDTENKTSIISTAAAMAKAASALEINPLTKDEWKSAYQIAKNESNGQVTKATTGASLPVTEEANTQDTGTQTVTQGKEQKHTTDGARANTELWNPVSNFAHYSSNVWGSSGSNWIAQGLISYEQKTAETDDNKMAKALEERQMAQDDTFPTDAPPLDYTV